ncbi:MAG: type III pantothenate kinase [Chlorobium sp.]
MSVYNEQSSPEALLLVVETGNTTTSFVVFSGSGSLEVQKMPSSSLSGHDAISGLLAPVLIKYPALCDAVICSVVPSLEKSIGDYLRRHLTGQVLLVSSSMRLPFMLHYNSPDTFGADRIALCALSQSLYPDHAVIALDIGTAITVDVLDSKRNYLGGLIMPGLDLMAKALHEHTARLPLVALDRQDTLLGYSTVECIRNGIILGCVSSMEGVVAKITSWLQHGCNEHNIKVIATGGSAPLVSSMLDCSPVVDELAVVKGTRLLFELNEQFLS